MQLTPEREDALIEAAAAVRRHAHVPYSHFHVGAALLLGDGSIVVGCNVENASYGMAICAERTAVVSAIAAGRRDFVAIAVVTDADDPAAPCGACRQVLAEFALPMPVLIANLRGYRRRTTVSELLPGAFTGFTPDPDDAPGNTIAGTETA